MIVYGIHSLNYPGAAGLYLHVLPTAQSECLRVDLGQGRAERIATSFRSLSGCGMTSWLDCGRVSYMCAILHIRLTAKTVTNVGIVQRVIKNRVRAPTHHTGNKSPDTRRGSLASLAIHNPCRSRFITFKRLCIHCTQVNILRLQDTLKPLSPSLHLATSFCANYSSDTIVSDI